MTIKDRLKLYLSYKNLSSRELERQCNISNGVMGRLSQSTSPKTLKRIEENSDLNVSWLLSGEGEMIKLSNNTARMLGEVYTSTQGDENVVMVDYVPGTATATFIEYIGEGNPGLEKIAVLKQYGETYDNSYKVFEVIGESMSPRIPNRAKILTKEIPSFKWGQAEGVVVIVFGDEVVVKRIINNRLDINNSLTLSSDNPMYGERQVALSDIRAMYKAIRIISAEIA